MSNQKVNCLNIAYIFKSSIGSINGSWTEGNVSTVKKITLPSGRQIPYVSGQSIKYQIRRAWKESGLQMSEVKAAEKSKGVDVTLGNPVDFIDDDLLGFMIASTGENRRRTAPVRISPAVGIFEYRGDRDLGTKSKELTGDNKMDAGGNIFETEISYNYYKVNVLIELDRVGKFLKHETGKKEEALSIDKRRERVISFLDAIRHIWGGGKQGRLLTDMSPKFVAITFQTVKSPIFLESMVVNDEECLEMLPIEESINGNSAIIEKTELGIQAGIFKNNARSDSKTLSIGNIADAFTSAKDYLNTLDF